MKAGTLNPRPVSLDDPRDLEEHEPEQVGEVELDTLVESAPDATGMAQETPEVCIAPLVDLDPSDVALDPKLVERQASEALHVGIDIAPDDLSTVLSTSAGAPSGTPPSAQVGALPANREIEGPPGICRLEFPAVASSVASARRAAARALAGAPADALEVVRLLVSELASNAIEHVARSFHLAVYRTNTEIRVEVTDYGAGTPTMRSVGPEAVRGRGLKIVDMLSTDWGVEQQSDAAKTVWFILTLPPIPPA